MTDPAMPQWLEDIQRRGDEMVRQSQQLQEQLGELTETARSQDGTVAVTVGANGALRGVHIDDRALRGSAAELSAELMRLSAQAQANAARRAVALVEPIAGESATEFLRSQLPPESVDEAAGAPQDDDYDDEFGDPRDFLR